MITITSCLWEANETTMANSRCYDAAYAKRTFKSFKRQLSLPHRCVLFTDRHRDLPEWIEQIVEPDLGKKGYGDCVRPFVLNEPMIFAGLDTIAVNNIDHIAQWALTGTCPAMPRHPYFDLAINGVVVTPKGWDRIATEHRGENDMKWMREFPHVLMDDKWPGAVQSYKAHVRPQEKQHGLSGTTKIVYFHGKPKPHELMHLPWVKEHWR